MTFSPNSSNSSIEEFPIKVIKLGLGWLKSGSPEDGFGLKISGFELYQTYSIDQTHVTKISKKLYERVYQA